MLLRSIAIISILISGVWAAEESNSIETGTKIVIKREYYSNANLGKDLKKNDKVTHLIINTNYDWRESGAYENFKNFTKEGMQNKPNLKILEIIGDFDMNLWFQTPSSGQDYEASFKALEIQKKYLHSKNPCMAWFFNLKEFIINGNVNGSLNDGFNFSLLTKEDAPNLKKLKVTDPPGLSFDRP